MRSVAKPVRTRPIIQQDHLLALNDEIVPMLRELRELLNRMFAAPEQTASASGATTVDWTSYQYRSLTLTGNTTPTFLAPEGAATLVLRLIQDSVGGRTVTWPASVNWASGVAPVLTAAGNAVDLIHLYFDGAFYNGIAVLNLS